MDLALLSERNGNKNSTKRQKERKIIHELTEETLCGSITHIVLYSQICPGVLSPW
jgi:hypothetical protein